MGLSCSKDEKGGQNKNESRIDERGTKHTKKIPLDIIIKTSKSICKILYEKNKEIQTGTGFFLKLKKHPKCMLTNYHVISESQINTQINIQIYNKEKIDIKLNDRYYKFFEDLDITIIEIKDTDNIIKDIFLDYDLNYITGYDTYKNIDAFTLQYPKDDIEVASGRIIKIINKYEFKHSIDTDYDHLDLLLFYVIL